MKKEEKILIEGREYSVFISDEPEALLAAQAAGRAVVGVGIMVPAEIPYVVPELSDVTTELSELVLRRYLGLPWLIEETGRLKLRELTKEDAVRIPAEEYAKEEDIFRSTESLDLYCKTQYAFFEYGIWAVILKETGELVGLAGVTNPRLPEEFEAFLEKYGQEPCKAAKPGEEAVAQAAAGAEWEAAVQAASRPWLEIGYHIFKPYRNQGYGLEAAQAAASYAREVLGVRLCALIHEKNQASRRMAEHLKMAVLMEKGPEGSEPLLLYGERWR